MSNILRIHDRPVVPVILAGGSGKRLWPLSREAKPKPFLEFDFLNGESLIQNTLWRLRRIELDWIDLQEDPVDSDGFIKTVIVGNVAHKELINTQLWLHPMSNDLDILLEPEGKGTALAIACAVRHIQSTISNAIVMVFPSDHYVEDPIVLSVALHSAAREAVQGKIVTLGVKTAEPSPRFGYIVPCKNHTPLGLGSPIMFFEEKPSVERAQRLLTMGAYWNSGIFVFSADTFFEQLQVHAMGTAAISGMAYAEKNQVFGGTLLGSQSYTAYNSISGESIDKVLMELTNQGVVVPLGNCGWSDLGTWDAIVSMKVRLQGYDLQENYCEGNALFTNTQGSYVYSNTKRLVVLEGIEDCVVVDTGDILYVGKRGPDMLKYIRNEEWAK